MYPGAQTEGNARDDVIAGVPRSGERRSGNCRVGLVVVRDRCIREIDVVSKKTQAAPRPASSEVERWLRKIRFSGDPSLNPAK